ncbi:2-dehydropantoate 2-reductase [Gelidibacter algens]|uniref:2-dehydropantoate 2-reductase n=1 Tax=Gelidibacter algens TaxID=49280 RepID=A0A1A7QZ07_9FLAO|nr:2-dehydropantoate 2-reductase [Gelidibacter algens]OBX24459.1 2-dehydropantoate 2-reductase [Gelidibacter algens]RAJ19200.1 2-dehydropantoate 2-reductase [Gelidibacter algens]
MKITIIGLGGVGGYFGFKLAQTYYRSADVTITFVARNETYTIIKDKGLTLLSAEHANSKAFPNELINNLDDLPVSDILLICVKEYDLEAVCLTIKDKIKDDTFVLPLMNGADIYERIRKIIPNGIVLPACVYVASHMKEKARVEHKGKSGKIILGKDPLHQQFSPDNIVSLLKNAGIDLEFKENSLPDIWTKFFFIASFGLVTARYNKSIGQVNEEDNLKMEALAIMIEIKKIATLKAIKLSQTIIQDTFEKAATFPYHTPTSLQLDVQSKKAQNELELFAGTIIKYGKELGVEVPATTKVYEEIKLINVIP